MDIYICGPVSSEWLVVTAELKAQHTQGPEAGVLKELSLAGLAD